MTVTLAATSSLLGFAAAALCAMACWRLRDTTFLAPCAWAAAALGCLAIVEAAPMLYPVYSSKLLAEHLRYLASTTVVAPFVALLGAKRPQNAAWQWIVLSLIILLAFQDLRSWFIEAAAPSPHAAWRWLLAAIVTMQCCNYLPTSYGAPACVAYAGQCCLLAAYLPLQPQHPDWLFSLGVGTLSAAVILAAIVRLLKRQAAGAWQATWLQFRDLFGVLWALRVCQRVNAIAAEQQSARRLSWYGVLPSQVARTESPVAPRDTSDPEPLQRALRSVLSRFLSRKWFAENHKMSMESP